jgi:hypothetical protein
MAKSQKVVLYIATCCKPVHIPVPYLCTLLTTAELLVGIERSVLVCSAVAVSLESPTPAPGTGWASPREPASLAVSGKYVARAAWRCCGGAVFNK